MSPSHTHQCNVTSEQIYAGSTSVRRHYPTNACTCSTNCPLASHILTHLPTHLCLNPFPHLSKAHPPPIPRPKSRASQTNGPPTTLHLHHLLPFRLPMGSTTGPRLGRSIKVGAAGKTGIRSDTCCGATCAWWARQGWVSVCLPYSCKQHIGQSLTLMKYLFSSSLLRNLWRPAPRPIPLFDLAFCTARNVGTPRDRITARVRIRALYAALACPSICTRELDAP